MVSKTLAGNTTTYAYDLAGKAINTTDAAGTLHHTFDRLGRLAAVTDALGKKVRYACDELGQRTQLTYPDGNSVTYSYDSLGRLIDINDPNVGNLAHYEYDDLSRRVSVSYANGTSASYTYNGSDRLTQIAHTGLSQPSTYGYSYDLVGSRTGMLVNGAQQHSYTYDDIYQFTNVDYPQDYFQSDTTFTYDDASNRSQVDSPPTSYTTNSLNQYTFVGSEAFDYDDNGNLTSDGHSAYTYDAENRLVTATISGRTIQCTYDAAGRRIRKVANGRTTQYVYDGDEVIAEYDSSGELLRSFVYGPGIDEPICLRAYDFVIGDFTGDGLVNLEDLRSLAGKWLLSEAQSGYDPLYDLNQDGKITNADTDLLAAQWQKTAPPVQAFYYHFDGLGSVVALSDAAGTVVEIYAYDVYGRSRPTGLSHGNPYRFTARRWEPEIGLYDYRARYYNPQIGRFLQTDPIGYADGINWYAYCGNNPIVLVDPWGLGSQLATGAPGFWGNVWRGAVYGDLAQEDTGWGGLIGQIGAGFVPGVGQAGDIRDTAAAWGNFRAHPGFGTGGGLAMAGVAWVPGVGDAAKAVVKGGKKVGKKAVSLGRQAYKSLHHFATNKSMRYTPQMQDIASKYGLKLDGLWNKEMMTHNNGRHPNAMHDFVLDGMQKSDQRVLGSRDRFLEHYEELVKGPIRANPELLRKSGWEQ